MWFNKAKGKYRKTEKSYFYYSQHCIPPNCKEVSSLSNVSIRPFVGPAQSHFVASCKLLFQQQPVSLRRSRHSATKTPQKRPYRCRRRCRKRYIHHLFIWIKKWEEKDRCRFTSRAINVVLVVVAAVTVSTTSTIFTIFYCQRLIATEEEVRDDNKNILILDYCRWWWFLVVCCFTAS